MSKGGSTTSKTEIPAWLEGAAIENINKARGVSELGYVPYYGPDVAAFSPMQQQSMQSTGNAASAFGLAPQGFDATAGIPQAQSFAGGIQGYSSAPLYEESLAQLQQKRPAQYKAMTDMFIDPFTGARPSGDYTATPAQVDQMFSNSGGGGATPTPADPYAGYGDTGAYVGEGMTDTTNIGGVNYPNTLPPSMGMGSGTTGGLMSNGDAAAGIAGNLLDSSMFGQIYEGITGNPLAGGSPDAVVSDLSNDNALGYHSDGSAVSNPYDFGPSQGDITSLQNSQPAPSFPNTGPAGQFEPAVNYPTTGPAGGYNFTNAVPPTIQVEEAAAPTKVPDYTFPMGTKEDLSQGAQATPYAAPQVSSPVSNPVIESQNPVMKGLLADQLTSEYDLQTGLQDELAQDAKDAADKALKAKQAKDAVLAKAKAKKMAADKAKAIKIAEAKAASDAKIEEDAEAKAVALVQKQLDDEAAAKVAAKKKADATAAKKKAADKLIKDAEAAAVKAAAKKVADDKAAKKLADDKAAKKKAAAKLIKDAEAAAKVKADAKAAAKKKADATAAKKKAAAKLIKDAEAAQAAADAATAKAAAKAAAAAAAKAAQGGGGGGNNTWSPPKNNGYAGQGGSTKGKAKTGYSFGL